MQSQLLPFGILVSDLLSCENLGFAWYVIDCNYKGVALNS